MEIKNISFSNKQTDNNVFLAPLAGYTDYAFRSVAVGLGYGLCFTELVSAKGLFFGGDRSANLLQSDNYSVTAAQIFGSDPYYMRSACESEYLRPFDIIDINMGCPVPKVFSNGEGSALLQDILRAEKVISECVKSGKIITVKIRKGLNKGDDVAADFTKMAEQAGALMVTVHARSREDYYSGEPDYDSISRAKNAVKIPVIANGGIFTVADADKMINETGADGVMLARGALVNPLLVCELLGKKANLSLKEFITRHFDKMVVSVGENRAVVEFRKFVPYYFKGKENFKNVKMSLYTAESADEIKGILAENL